MLTLLTRNPKKYAPFQQILERIGLRLEPPRFELPEVQHRDFACVLAGKARAAAEATGRPCLVDDSGLLLDAYPGFPGPMTKYACEQLGATGFERLLAGVSRGARLQCHLGCWVGGKLWHWQGEVTGALDPGRPTAGGAGPLTDWFVPGPASTDGVFTHRRRALEALASDVDRLRSALPAPVAAAPVGVPEPERHRDCVFCAEFEDDPCSVFRRLAGKEIPSRIVHQTSHFVAFPPLGQFMEGGLLLATRAHFLSCARLPEPYYGELEQLVAEAAELLRAHYGCYPLVFEHAPASASDKGTCCVDHAHLNVFPAVVDVHRELERLPHARIRTFRELRGLGERGQPYLFLQTNAGERFVYEVDVVPSQHIRKIITSRLGVPERWHWREHLGLEELKRTLSALSSWR
jgi:inosine/xanthosine triphosphate pyrophosphatase family protein/diadenosine tetraphosphate (Ap4A) HIT family hydrolase